MSVPSDRTGLITAAVITGVAGIIAVWIGRDPQPNVALGMPAAVAAPVAPPSAATPVANKTSLQPHPAPAADAQDQLAKTQSVAGTSQDGRPRVLDKVEAAPPDTLKDEKKEGAVVVSRPTADSVPPSTSQPSSAPSLPEDVAVDDESLSQPRASAEGFSFVLRGCRGEGHGVRCDLTVKNDGRQADLRIFARARVGGQATRAHDSAGNEYVASNLRLESAEAPTDITHRLQNGQSAKVTFWFSDVPQNLTRFSYVDIGCYQFRPSPSGQRPFEVVRDIVNRENRGDFRVELANVNIRR